MPASSADSPKRPYLPSAQRKEEIREAALKAFSNHGYAGTTIEQIATLTGMSKAGLYAHYKSKEELFEDMLVRLLKPPFNSQAWLVDTPEQLRQTIDTFIEQTYSKLAEPDFIAMLRLLIAESGRFPHLTRRWHDEVLRPHIAEQQRIIDQCVERGTMRRSPLTRHFEIAVVPAPYGALWHMLFGIENSQEELNKIRETHRALLIELLTNPEESKA